MIYYVADGREKKRILVRFHKFERAQDYCRLLNDNHPGRFEIGSLVKRNMFGIDEPREWPWVSQSSNKDYLV